MRGLVSKNKQTNKQKLKTTAAMAKIKPEQDKALWWVVAEEQHVRLSPDLHMHARTHEYTATHTHLYTHVSLNM